MRQVQVEDVFGNHSIFSVVVVQLLSRVRLFVTPWTAARQASLSFTISQSLLKLSCPLSWWCHSTVSSSVIPFSSCLQSFPASGSFLVSQLFSSGGQLIGASASASVPPVNIQDWFPLGLTGLISFLSKGISRAFLSTRVQEHQFFGAQPSLWSNSHPYITAGRNHSFDYMGLCWQKSLAYPIPSNSYSSPSTHWASSWLISHLFSAYPRCLLTQLNSMVNPCSPSLASSYMHLIQL